ncbi:MAG TPA: hypothetical protein VJK52_03480 [Candidatus Nanoarchaeia archaeon]|nr:hypothetical protein [Candidatus Nanoarchaeia archaeon]
MKPVRDRTIVLLTLVLALLVIAGTYLIVEEVQTYRAAKAARMMQSPTSVGEVSVLVLPSGETGPQETGP